MKNPTEELTGIYSFHSSRGIFRCAQYDGLFYLSLRGSVATKQARQPVPLSSRLRAPPPPFHRGNLPRRRKRITVILNGSEESHRRTDRHIFFSLKSWDISLRSIRRTFLFVFARKRSDEAGSTARPPFVALMRATSPVSSGESTPGRVVFRKACTCSLRSWDISLRSI